MKYVIILGDGMADYPIKELNNKTPLEVANIPTITALAKQGEVGLVKTIPNGMKAGSDVANLSVLGYAVQDIYTGRSPLEAANIGINLKETDVTARANLVTLSGEGDFESLTMKDYSAGEISTAESKELIEYLAQKLNTDKLKLYAGVSYRHCLVIDNGLIAGDLTPPHDITGRAIKEYLPNSSQGKLYLALMKKSKELLENHPINQARIKAGKNPANSLWFWGEGTKPKVQNFYERNGVNAGMISAVDLLNGIGRLAGMEIISVEGATGNYDTNFSGKAKACLRALDNGCDFVYIHMEAPDECGHHGDLEHKIYSIEQIDGVVNTIYNELSKKGEDFSLLILPDHPTPISIKTHVANPVPYLRYLSGKNISNGAGAYTEKEAEQTKLFISSGVELMQRFLQKNI